MSIPLPFRKPSARDRARQEWIDERLREARIVVADVVNHSDHLLRLACNVLVQHGDARLWSETTRIDLRVAEVPNPRPGDRVEIEGEAFIIQGEPVRDRERLIWTVDLRPT